MLALAYYQEDLVTPGIFPSRASSRKVKREIRGELHLTASVGVGPNKFLAKLASDLEKPDGLVVIRPRGAEEFLAPLPVGRLWGVGPKTAKLLQERGLKTIGDVARTPVEELVQ